MPTQHGLARFQSAQMYYSLASRDIEREVVPLAEDQGLAILPWSPLAGGLLSGKFDLDKPGPEGARRSTFDFPPVDRAADEGGARSAARAVSQATGVSVPRVALAWLLTRPFVTSVIIGAKTPEQLADNLAASDVTARRRARRPTRRRQRIAAGVSGLDDRTSEPEPPAGIAVGIRDWVLEIGGATHGNGRIAGRLRAMPSIVCRASAVGAFVVEMVALAAYPWPGCSHLDLRNANWTYNVFWRSCCAFAFCESNPLACESGRRQVASHALVQLSERCYDSDFFMDSSRQLMSNSLAWPRASFAARRGSSCRSSRSTRCSRRSRRNTASICWST